MIEAILITLALVALWHRGTSTTYQRYAAVMAFRRARDAGKLTKEARWFAYPAAGEAWLVDVLYCWIMGWWPFLLLGNPAKAIPREAMFTHYLERQMKGCGLRARLARWMCRGMLDPLDSRGRHCD